MRYRLDAGSPTALCVVGICDEPGCGARVLANSRAGALALLAGHRDVAHPELRNLPLYYLNVELKRPA